MLPCTALKAHGLCLVACLPAGVSPSDCGQDLDSKDSCCANTLDLQGHLQLLSQQKQQLKLDYTEVHATYHARQEQVAAKVRVR